MRERKIASDSCRMPDNPHRKPEGRKKDRGRRKRPERRWFVNWYRERAADLEDAVSPAVNRHYDKIPKGKFQPHLLTKTEVVRAAAINMMDHPKQSRRPLTYQQACGLFGEFVKRYCERVARKQLVRDRVGRKLADRVDLEKEAQDEA